MTRFQRGMSLSTLIERYGNEAACESAQLRARWRAGFPYLECGEREHATYLVDGR